MRQLSAQQPWVEVAVVPGVPFAWCASKGQDRFVPQLLDLLKEVVVLLAGCSLAWPTILASWCFWTDQAVDMTGRPMVEISRYGFRPSAVGPAWANRGDSESLHKYSGLRRVREDVPWRL